jgi:predicted NUDIX family NTP pyrophosphohydrolase
LYRLSGEQPEVLLVHPGGPFWRARDIGAWSIPKGEVADGEELLEAARREFHEETGFSSDAPAQPLGYVRLSSGKLVYAFAAEGDLDPSLVRSITFELEWPRGSGTIRAFPEVDRAAWFDLHEARRRILPAQSALLDAFETSLKS